MSWDEIVAFFKQIINAKELVSNAGYAGMAAVIFIETGLLVGFFLPGDSLLFTAGLACNPNSDLHKLVGFNLLTLNLVLVPAAILGDTVGYWIGYRAGRGMYTRERTLFFRKDHLLYTKDYYEKHGGITIVIARFVPLLRTFAPVVAGIAQMPYRDFIFYNVIGGIGWVTGLSVLGYFLGHIDAISQHLDITIMVIIFVSLLPVIFTVGKAWLSGRKPSEAAADVVTAKTVDDTPSPAARTENVPTAD